MGSPRNAPTATRVTGATWATHPMKNPKTAPWNLPLSHSDTTKLLRGYQPTAMEDRWMCRADGPDAQGNFTIHAYRSWTGDEQFQIKATKQNSETPNASFTHITWDRGVGSSRVTEGEAKSLVTMVCRGVLGCELRHAS